MVAPAIFLAAIFEDADAAALGSIGGGQLLEPDDAVRDAVDRLVGRLAGQIVEEQNGRAAADEEVLDREDLTPIAQRALSEQADLGEAVQHDAPGVHALDDVENLLGHLAELEIGGIKKALLLILVKDAVGRDQLEYLDLVAQRPAVRGRAFAQLPLGLR